MYTIKRRLTLYCSLAPSTPCLSNCRTMPVQLLLQYHGSYLYNCTICSELYHRSLSWSLHPSGPCKPAGAAAPRQRTMYRRSILYPIHYHPKSSIKRTYHDTGEFSHMAYTILELAHRIRTGPCCATTSPRPWWKDMGDVGHRSIARPITRTLLASV